MKPTRFWKSRVYAAVFVVVCETGMKKCSLPVSWSRLVTNQLPIHRQGETNICVFGLKLLAIEWTFGMPWWSISRSECFCFSQWVILLEMLKSICWNYLDIALLSTRIHFSTILHYLGSWLMLWPCLHCAPNLQICMMKMAGCHFSTNHTYRASMPMQIGLVLCGRAHPNCGARNADMEAYKIAGRRPAMKRTRCRGTSPFSDSTSLPDSDLSIHSCSYLTDY